MPRPQAPVALVLLVLCSFRPLEASNGKFGRLLFFTAPWCEPCHKMEPLVANLAKKYKVEMVSVDFDRSPQAVEDFKVESLPTIILLDSQGQLLFRAEGASRQTMRALTTALKTLERHKGNINQGR